MSVTVYPPTSSVNPDAAPITVAAGDTWRLGQNGSLQVLDAAQAVVAEWAANQWSYVTAGEPA